MALQFQINLTGNFAEQLKPHNVELAKTEGHAKHAAHGLELFEVEVGKLKTSLAGLEFNIGGLAKGSGTLFTFDMAEGAHLAFEAFEGLVEIIHKAVEALVELGAEMIHDAAAAQDLGVAVKLNVGEQGAEAVEKLAESFTNTRFSPREITQSLLPLMDEGIKDTKLLDDLATAATDIAARRNRGMDQVQSSLGAFANIALRRTVNAKILRELAVNEKDYFTDLGSLLHISAAGAQKMTKEGRVSAQTLLSVALHQVAEREGGSIGKAALEAGQTVSAQLAKLKVLPERYFETLSKSAGFERFSGFLGNLFDALDPQSPNGQRVQAALERLFNRMMDLFGGGKEGADGIADTIINLIGLVGDLVPMVVTLGKVLLSAASSIADVVQGIRLAMALSSGDKATATEIVRESILRKQRELAERDDLDRMMENRGRAAVAGFTAGINLGSGDITDAMLALATVTKDGISKPLEIHSPSRVFEAYGRQTVEGFALGIESGSARAAAAQRMLAGAAIDGGPLGAAGANAGGISIVNHMIFGGIGGSESGGREAAAAFAQEWRSQMKKFLVEAGYSFGVLDVAGEGA